MTSSTAIFTDGDDNGTTIEVREQETTYSVDINGDAAVLINKGEELKMSEALDFAAGVLGSKVPGRLSPFTRRFISLGAQIFAATSKDVADEPELTEEDTAPDTAHPEFTSLEVHMAIMAMSVMALNAKHGLRIGQAIEALVAKKYLN